VPSLLGQGFTPSLTSAGFTKKWHDTPFLSRRQEVAVTVEYNKQSDLGMVSKQADAAQMTQANEHVDVAIPGDIQFSGLRQYTLYAHALALARLHDRRATGYTVHVNDFHRHSVAPVPKHKEYAAQAKQIAEQTLHASDKDLDKLASQLVALNKGHGWSKSRQLDDQMRYAAWEALCAENTEAKQDVMRMSEDTARFDPVMKKLHSLLHRDAQSAKAAQTRNEDSRLAGKQIDQNLARWVEEARTRFPNDDQLAEAVVQQQIRDVCDEALKRDRWSPVRKRRRTERIIEDRIEKIKSMFKAAPF
jgi:hypothetical protein